MESPPDIVVRRAVPADAAILAGLRFEFRTAIRAPAETEPAFVERAGGWIAERLREGGSWLCWIAVREDVVVGNVWLRLLEKMPNPVGEREWYGYITNLYVKAELRGAGIGSRLLDSAVQECRDRRVDTVLLWPTPDSMRLYERHGFVPTNDILGLYL